MPSDTNSPRSTHLTGLSSAEAAARLSREGYNDLSSTTRSSLWTLVRDVLGEPMILLLLACGAIYLVLGDAREAALLLASIGFVIGIDLYQEHKTERAREVYERFRDTVFRAAAGRLDTYIEMHQNGSEANIEVATLGISREEAIAIKSDYLEIRDRILQGMPDLIRVDLVIEPVDQVAIGAWAAKDHGMLRLSQTSLPFELPAQRLFYRNRPRRAYTRILSELVDRLVKSRRATSEAK